MNEMTALFFQNLVDIKEDNLHGFLVSYFREHKFMFVHVKYQNGNLCFKSGAKLPINVGDTEIKCENGHCYIMFIYRLPSGHDQVRLSVCLFYGTTDKKFHYTEYVDNDRVPWPWQV